MKTINDVREAQKVCIAGLLSDIKKYIDEINKDNIETILISGSVSRGDYFPGEMGGMIDLTVMKTEESNKTAVDIFGQNEDPDIPFHCVKRNGNWYQIDYMQFVDIEIFRLLAETKKYALVESKILYDKKNRYQKELLGITELSKCEHKKEIEHCLRNIRYMLSDYKTDRWKRREAYIQMHENLNNAISTSIKCLYYMNGMYCAPEDRRLYYCLGLNKIPNNFMETVIELYKQDIDSLEDYERREKLFKSKIVEYIKENCPTTGST